VTNQKIRSELARNPSKFYTFSEANWILACETAGLQVQKHKTGAMALNLRRMFQDEGVVNTLRILGIF